tara:strand:+ start:293 stop:1459 length:1167 start_codon:yes stop_codon:yes gene_type:complete
MNNFVTVIDFGSNNLRLGIFDKTSKNIYSSKKKIINDSENTTIEKSLNIIIRDAEKFLSSHIDNVVVLYDSSKFYSLDISIKKVFDHETSIKKVYDNLIKEAHFVISQNNFKDQVIHLLVNNIYVDGYKKLETIIEDIKIKSLILEIKFICLSKILINKISNQFKKNNLKILNIYCSSYVKAFSYKYESGIKDNIIFLDIGFERTSCFIFNKNKLNSFKSISLGGNNITKDISKVLNLNLDYSEDLKIKFNKLENKVSFSKSNLKEINPYSEISEKNISIDILKQIIEARIDEIFELVVLRSDYIINLKLLEKPKLVIVGGGSKLFLNNYKLSINKSVSELIILNQNNFNICEAGFKFHKSEESFLIKTKKKIKKSGFFESFFNLFSK